MEGQIVGVTSFGIDIPPSGDGQMSNSMRTSKATAGAGLGVDHDRGAGATPNCHGTARRGCAVACLCSHGARVPPARRLARPKLQRIWTEVSQILRESLEQIQEVLLDLSSPSMNEIGLGVAISDWLAEQHIGKRHGLRTSFVDECGKVPLDDDVRAVLFRNTRELLANVVKHAQADTVAVRMESTGEALRITIKDDGVGLDPDNAADTSGGGYGIFSIQERMLDLGGSLEIVSARGKGCEATLVMPLDKGE